MLFGMDTGGIGGILVLPAFQEYVLPTVLRSREWADKGQKVRA